jgi:GR25 family glycosyltransferase involved in LPS biosynthesis
MNKLKGFSPLYIINLERRSDRKNNIESDLKKYNILDYHFIKAIDYKDKNLKEKIYSPVAIKEEELACTLSHLEAIRFWLENNNSEYAIILEDDFSFVTVDFWDFSWEEFIKSLDFEYDILQIVIMNEIDLNVNLHKRSSDDQSTAGYLITREYAKSMIDKMFVDGKYRLPKYCVADYFLYEIANSYAIPLFVTREWDGSDINPQDEEWQINRRDEILKYWKEN